MRVIPRCDDGGVSALANPDRTAPGGHACPVVSTVGVSAHRDRGGSRLTWVRQPGNALYSLGVSDHLDTVGTEAAAARRDSIEVPDFAEIMTATSREGVRRANSMASGVLRGSSGQ